MTQPSGRSFDANQDRSARPLAVVAIGGNALVRDPAHESLPDQFAVASQIAVNVAAMIETGWNVVLTHGNGPQVGFILRRSELSARELPPVPMDYAGAGTQGAVGWMLVRALGNELRRRGMRRETVAIVTQTIVDRADPAFASPRKPIGSPSWRSLVPSPLPKAIVETEAIRHMAHAGYVVVACGGGGIPVVEDADGTLRGVEAVIDKDLASSLLARSLRADALVSLTSVEQAALDFNKPSQRPIDLMTLAEARRYYAEEQFEEGSMGPKVAALIEFVAAGGKLGLITSPASLPRALRGETGTRVVPD